MMCSRAWIASLALLFVSTSAGGAPAIGGDCAALDQLLRQAGTEFPALRQKSFERAKCSQRRTTFNCEWSFPGDTYAAAETQAARLTRCTAAQPNARPLWAKHDEAGFQINPETAVLIEGPELDSGSWKIRLQITNTSDWD